MAKRLKDVCKIQEDETLWRAGRGFIVRDLPRSETELRRIPPFEFENWAVIALGGIKNKAQVGDMGIDGRIYPVSATPKTAKDAFDFMDQWYPIQVKQKDKAGRPDIDSFEAVMARENLRPPPSHGAISSLLRSVCFRCCLFIHFPKPPRVAQAPPNAVDAGGTCRSEYPSHMPTKFRAPSILRMSTPWPEVVEFFVRTLPR